DGRIVASVGSLLKLWDVTNGHEVHTPTHGGPAAFSPDGRTIVSGGFGNNLSLWDVASGRELRSFSGRADGDELRNFIQEQDAAKSLSRSKRLWTEPDLLLDDPSLFPDPLTGPLSRLRPWTQPKPLLDDSSLLPDSSLTRPLARLGATTGIVTAVAF